MAFPTNLKLKKRSKISDCIDQALKEAKGIMPAAAVREIILVHLKEFLVEEAERSGEDAEALAIFFSDIFHRESFETKSNRTEKPLTAV